MAPCACSGAMECDQAGRGRGRMTVHFIGAGPGAADLLTVRATRLLAASPVCLYAGSLSPDEVLAYCSPGTRLVDTADLTLDQIVDVMVQADAAGQDVARLCSGDPSVWSALTEQVRRLDAAGAQYDVTPGGPSFAAAAAGLPQEPTVPAGGARKCATHTRGRRAPPPPRGGAAAAVLRQELTVPAVGQSIVLTRTQARSTPMPEGERLAAFAATGATLALHLAVQRIDVLAPELAEHYGADCPVAVVQRASQPG